MTKILILGGTSEAAELAKHLVAEGHDVTTSLAGRTREPDPVSGSIRIGGFGGANGLIAYLKTNTVEKLIDATHPFARKISANAKTAAQETGIEYEKIERPPWKKQPGDDWIEVNSLEQACTAIPASARVLLALGSQHINRFNTRDDVFFLVRMVDRPEEPLSLPDYKLLIGKPATDWKEEMRMLQEYDLTHIVCRNSGGSRAYAKIRAARSLGLPVIIIER